MRPVVNLSLYISHRNKTRNAILNTENTALNSFFFKRLILTDSPIEIKNGFHDGIFYTVPTNHLKYIEYNTIQEYNNKNNNHNIETVIFLYKYHSCTAGPLVYCEIKSMHLIVCGTDVNGCETVCLRLMNETFPMA